MARPDLSFGDLQLSQGGSQAKPRQGLSREGRVVRFDLTPDFDEAFCVAARAALVGSSMGQLQDRQTVFLLKSQGKMENTLS